MLFPISDDDKDLKGYAPVSIILILANLAVFFLFQQTGENQAFTYGWSVIPFEITNGVDLVAPQALNIEGQREMIPQAPGPSPIYLTILSAMFMHGGWMHLLGNMVFLWIFGDNIEDSMGHKKFLAFYLICGVFAAFLQAIINVVFPLGSVALPFQLLLRIFSARAFHASDTARHRTRASVLKPSKICSPMCGSPGLIIKLFMFLLCNSRYNDMFCLTSNCLFRL